MSLIIDFLLLAASGTACFYCWILSKRLKALTNNKDGIQTGIVALSQSAEEMQDALATTKDAANASVAQLELLINEAQQKTPELEALLQQITDVSTQAVTETESAARNLVDILSPHIEDAKTSANLLLRSLEVASQEMPDANEPKVASEPKAEKKTPAANAEPQESDVSDDGLDIEFVAEDDETEAA